MKPLWILMIFTVWIAHAALVPGATPTSDRETCVREGSEKNSTPGFKAVRVLKDPSSDRRWQMERNLERPGWPGRLVPLRSQSSCSDQARSRQNPPGDRMGLDDSDPVIRAGEALIIVEDTKTAHAEFAALAVSNARRGEAISARLQIGGKLVKAVATGHGRAVFANRSLEESR